MITKPIKAVILGLGNQACEHLTASIGHPDVKIIAGVDPNTERHQKIQDEFSELNLQFFNDIQDLQNSQLEFDALILALPHHAYESIWDQIMKIGKPLLKEKPLGRNYQEAKRFMLTARNAGCGLQTAIQRRHHPSYQYLLKYLQDNQIQIYELHAHLHLGKKPQLPTAVTNNMWRNNRQLSGGGALLDVGYHLVDLVQFIVGDFEVVSSTMWNETGIDNGINNEDRCWLMGCTSDIWLMLDTWVQGEPNAEGGLNKSELIELYTNQGIICANREGVWCDHKLLFETNKQWEEAMKNQLTQFAQHIIHDDWGHNSIWDQLPAMRTIDKAYLLSQSY